MTAIYKIKDQGSILATGIVTIMIFVLGIFIVTTKDIQIRELIGYYSGFGMIVFSVWIFYEVLKSITFEKVKGSL